MPFPLGIDVVIFVLLPFLSVPAIFLHLKVFFFLVLIEGSPGVGKTSLIAAIGKFSGHTVVRINLSEQVKLSMATVTRVSCCVEVFCTVKESYSLLYLDRNGF